MNIPTTPLNMKASKVNFHTGRHPETGEPAIVIDFTIDGDEWYNHGIYIGDALATKEVVKANLLKLGATEQRAEQFFKKLEPPTAINKKHQAFVNRFVSWNAKYNKIVDTCDGEEGRKGEHAYNKASEFWVELPKREQQNITKTLDTLGFGS